MSSTVSYTIKKSVKLSKVKYAGVGIIDVSEPAPGTLKLHICWNVFPLIATKVELYIAVIISDTLSPVMSIKIDGFTIPLNLSSYITLVLLD